MRSEADIAICGAGIGGLTAALALDARGFKVSVYEQADKLGEVGAGLQLAANSVRILFDLGLEESLMSLASVPEGKRVRLWNSGNVWKLFDLGVESVERYGVPYLTMHRADLHAVMVDALLARQPGSIHLNKKLESFDEGKESVTLQFGDGTSASADVLVGADGVHSVVRNQTFGATVPEFSGCVAWRGVIPAEKLKDELRLPLGTNWIGPSGHIVQYPLRGGELMNFVGIIERDDWQVESWNSVGSHDECHRDFAGWHEDVHALIGEIGTPMKWALMLRPTIPTWSTERVTLLGDAAHPTLPFLAQGAGMAIEDGMVLARCLAAYPGDPRKAFESYETLRVERTSKIVRGSADNARRFHNPKLADPVEAEKYVNVEWEEKKIKQRYDWLFEYDALTVPV